MAALIGDFVPDLSRFHSIISGSASISQHQAQQHSAHDSPSSSTSSSAAAAAAAAVAYRSSSRNRPSSSLSAPRSLRPDACVQAQSATTTAPSASASSSSSASASTSTTTPAAAASTTTTSSSTGAGASRTAQQGQRLGLKPKPRQGQGDAQPGQPGARTTSSSTPSGGAVSQFPSPPPSSSPTAHPGPSAANHGKAAPIAPHMGDRISSADGSLSNPAGHDPARRRRQQPSPPGDFPVPATAAPAAPAANMSSHPSPVPGSYLVASAAASSQRMAQRDVVRVRDLAHIEALVHAEMLNGAGGEEGAQGDAANGSAAGTASNSGSGSRTLNGGHGLHLGILQDPPLHQVQYEISGMPISDIIEMVAALLTKITATNDLQHDAMQRNVAHQQQANQNAEPGAGGSQMSPLSHSVLAFHGKNVPAITILSYLSRIHKYCPTTYEVFLSLLVYFDRMTERVNDLVMQSEEARSRAGSRRLLSPHDSLTSRRGGARSSDASGSDLADDDDNDGNDNKNDDDDDDDDDDRDDDEEEEDEGGDEGETEGSEAERGAYAADEDDDMVDSPAVVADHRGEGSGFGSARATATEPAPLSASATYFVVDSFNIHRLIIAGVTCASKFFSDVFYTNSRYAKVGGLPLGELNHLEIQFLVLNDFRLAVPVEDLETYATMLVEFYAREVVAPRHRRSAAE